LELLLAHGDDGSPVLDREADLQRVAAQARPGPRDDDRTRRGARNRVLADITADANDLVRQGWAVVAPAGPEGDRLIALVGALIALRTADQKDDALAIRVPPGMDAAAATAWNKDVYPTLYGEDETRRPRYLLILGDLDQVSLATQQVLAHDGLVGRLACTSDAGYAAYAEKVVAWQRGSLRFDRARAAFYTVRDGTRATEAGFAKLIMPCVERCTRTARDKAWAFPAEAIDVRGAAASAAPAPDDLLALAAARHPQVLLSMSHGMGPPRRRSWTPAEARDLQGAMSFGAEGAITGRELAAQPFLPGGIWIYFACFGAGTPSTSAYHHWLDLLAREGMTELGPLGAALHGLDHASGFVSGVAKAALANPDGPLAILGHIDLAWSYSYEELRVDGDRRITGSNRSLNFFHVMSKLVAGERAGAAGLALQLQLGSVAAELTAHYDRCKRAGSIEGAAPADVLALGNLWMLHQDLLGYAWLGDPAVRLPLASQGAGDQTRRLAPIAMTSARAAAPIDPAARTLSTESTESTAPTAPAEPSARPAPAEPARRTGRVSDGPASEIDRLERAALAIIDGSSPGVLASELGVPRSELVEAAERYRAAGRAQLADLVARSERERARRS
jgi:hypothetical protein